MEKEVTGNNYYTILKSFNIKGFCHLEKKSKRFSKDIKYINYPILVCSQYGWEDGCNDYYSILYPPFKLEKCIFGNADSLSHIILNCSKSLEINTKQANILKEKFSIYQNFDRWITLQYIPDIETSYIDNFLLYLEVKYGKNGSREGWKNIRKDIINPNTELYILYNSVLKKIEDEKENSNKQVHKLLKQLLKHPFGCKFYKIQKFDKYSIGLYDVKRKVWIERCGLLLPKKYPSAKRQLEKVNNLFALIEEIDNWEERKKDKYNYNMLEVC